MNCLRIFFMVACLFLYRQPVFSQYILNGSAEKNSCNCYTLTKTGQFLSGSVWNSNKINLNNSFDFWFNVFLGCSDRGADGMVFILQPISTSVGSSGEGMGFGGVAPSIGIALDTYQNFNLNDPAADHISIQANGTINHSSDLAGPVPISSTTNDVEDCQWHKLRITWDANTKWLRTYFDGVLRLEKQVDLVTDIFRNDPNVYWGFAGATGGEANLQQFCTALDPIFTTNITNNTLCEEEPVSFIDASESFAPIASYNWSFGDGTFSNEKVPSPHIYSTPGKYAVTLKIKGQDGCERDSTRIMTVGSIPVADVEVFDTCYTNNPRIELKGENFEVGYQWMIDGVVVPGSQQPMITNLSPGAHQLQVTAFSNFSCGQPAIAAADFIIKPKPVIAANVKDGCINENLVLEGVQIDTETTIDSWTWMVNNNQVEHDKTIKKTFGKEGEYSIKLWASASNNCFADTITQTIKVSRAVLSASDTTIMTNIPAQLHVSGNGSFLWSPSTGLNNPAVSNPIATLNNDQVYTITVTTPEGCTTTKDIKVNVLKGPNVFVPSAFTPNMDGKNDILLPVYVGIRELKHFLIFNRWGQKLFETNSFQKGWDGSNMPQGTYIWMIQATNYLGQPITLKGTVTLIQ